MRSAFFVLLGCTFLLSSVSPSAATPAFAPENPEQKRPTGVVELGGDPNSMRGPLQEGAFPSPSGTVQGTESKRRGSPERNPGDGAVDSTRSTGDGGAPEALTDSTEKDEILPLGVDVLPFAGTSSAMPYAVRSVSLNVLGGISGGVRTIELGSMLNLTAGDVRWVQLSGVVNGIEGSVTGFQGAGALNVALQSVSGAQGAGGVNIARKGVTGVQGSGGLNVTFQSISGVQGAGGANVALKGVTGVQGAGGANIAFESVTGVQGAGALNVTLHSVSGVQGAGAANVALKTVEGLQAAGALNVAGARVHGAQLSPFNVALKNVEGVQVGLVNVARQSTASIGLLSVIFDGFVDIEASRSLGGLTLASLRHGGDHVYNLYSAGLYPSAEDVLPAFGLGIGWRRVVSPTWEVSVDVTSSRIGRFDDEPGALLTNLRPLVGWRPAPYVSIFGGPTLNVQIYDADFSAGSVAPYETWRWESEEDDSRLILWPGFTLGVRLL